MLKNYLFSFIVPVYNTELQLLEKCLLSLTKIKKIKYEVIIVDDGSKEEIRMFCEEFISIHNNFLYIRQKNSGVSAARNNGITKASGTHICFVDSDDEIISSFYDDININYDLVMGDLLVVDEFDNIVDNWSEFDKTSQISAESLILKLGKTQRLNGPVAKIFRKSIIEKWNVRFRDDLIQGEDLFFLLDYINHVESCYYYKKAAYKYHLSSNTYLNRIWDYPFEMLHSYNTIFEEMLRRIDIVHVGIKEKRKTKKTIINEYLKRMIIGKSLIIHHYKSNNKKLDTNVLNNECVKCVDTINKYSTNSVAIKLVELLLLSKCDVAFCFLAKLFLVKQKRKRS